MSVDILTNQEFVGIAVYGGAIGLLNDREAQVAFAEAIKALNIHAWNTYYGGRYDPCEGRADVALPIIIGPAEEVPPPATIEAWIGTLKYFIGPCQMARKDIQHTPERHTLDQIHLSAFRLRRQGRRS